MRPALAALALSVGGGSFLLAQATPSTTAPTTRPAATQSQPSVRVNRVEGDRLITPTGFFERPGLQEPRLPRPATKAYLIRIDADISTSLRKILEYQIMRIARDAELVIFEVNSDGGDLQAMREIMMLIPARLGHAHTVAFVRSRALSAAALISLSCNQIVMEHGSQIGASTILPVMPPEQRGKYESAVRAQVRSLAVSHGQSPELWQGMVTNSMVIWLIRHRPTGRLEIVDAAAWDDKVAGVPRAMHVASGPAVEPPSAEWEFVRQIDDNVGVVTMTSDEALGLGAAWATVGSLDDVCRLYGVQGELRAMQETWSERLVRFLTRQEVAALIFFIGLVAAWIEWQIPGFGVAGVIAILCFALLFGGGYLVGMAQVWEIALVVVGLGLLVAEIFVTPGFGALGILGLVCVLVGLLAALVPNRPGELPLPAGPLDWRLFLDGLFWMMLALVAAVGSALVLARYLPRTPGVSKLALEPPAAGRVQPSDADDPLGRIRPGDVGMVEARCRPAGKVRFGQDLVDAASEGGVIESGQTVRVLCNEGNLVVVEKA